MAPTHSGGRRTRLRHLLSVTLAVASLCLGTAVASSAVAATFNPERIISDDNMRDYNSMSEADIQAFLQSSPVLASYEAVDYPSGKKVAASKIIYNAAQNFQVNPRVILTMLQKEQSLLTRSKSSLITKGHATLDWALGMGCPDVDLTKPSTYARCISSGCHSKAPGDNRFPEYRGFGKQVWAGTMSLSAYGEKGKYRPQWHHVKTKVAESSTWTPPATMKIGSVKLTVRNLATYKLYTYNPSIGCASKYYSNPTKDSGLSGNANFWVIYRKYFGDTFATPAVRPIYRLRNLKNGNYFYTKSQAERYNFAKSSTWKYERVGFSWDTSATANKVPVYRFLNRKTREYLFTANPKMVRWLRGPVKSPLWRYDGPAFKCSTSPKSATPVYQFTNKKTGRYFLTTSKAERSTMLSSANKKKWIYRGAVFYMAHR